MLSDYFKKNSDLQKVVIGIIILFFIFNLSILVVSILMDTYDLKQIIKMARYISFMKYFVIINMVLLITIILIYKFEIRRLKKKSKLYREDFNRLKSTSYDRQMEKSRIIEG
jgi:uncharacterized membrane protein YcjF (UPF0283 family)